MKKIVNILLLMAAVCSHVQAQQGTSCWNALSLGREYNDTILQAGTVWYKGNTFDLPLTMRFFPHNNTDTPPVIKLDFSCTPGEYDNEVLCSLFCHPTSAYFTLPHTATPYRKEDEQGHVYYEISMGEFYLNKLLEAGISENVEVFVEVTYYGSGRISLTPDAEFSQCMETDNWLLLGRKRKVEANDAETYFVAPYSNWTNDSIRYIWEGTAPATITIGTTCDYDALDVMDTHRVDVMQMKAHDTVNQSNALIREYMEYMNNASNTAKGGMFYVKAISLEPGILKVERIPAKGPGNGAVLLSYDIAASVSANDDTTVYAIPDTWTAATRFDTPTDYVFKMYVGTTHDFSKTDAIAVYSFKKNEEGHWCGILDVGMEALWAQTEDTYLYVRFECTAATTITPTAWIPSDCIENTKFLEKNTEVQVSKDKTIHRFYFNDWKDGDMSFVWNKTSLCKVLVSGLCTIGTNGDNESVCGYKELNGSNTLYRITAAGLAEWEEEVDEDGYLYVRFYTTDAGGGTITISSTAPEETDPIPCVTTYGEENEVACDSMEWKGTWYYASGDYPYPLTNAGGCDSVVTLHLTVHSSYVADTTAEQSGTFEWHGVPYTKSGEYTYDAKTVFGCDSIVTLHLTIKQDATKAETSDIPFVPTKRLEDGQVIILRGKERYSVYGLKMEE